MVLVNSFVYPLREAIVGIPAIGRDRIPRSDWLRCTQAAFEQALLANRWYLAWLYWMDALWLNARLVKNTATDWELIPDKYLEINRQVSGFRRQRKLESLLLTLTTVPAVSVASTMRTIECNWVGSKLLTRTQPIRGGKPSWSDRIRHHALTPQLYFSFHVEDVDLRLPSATVKARDAVRFYSSLLVLFFEFLEMLPQRQRANELFMRDAVCVSVPNLINTLADLLEVSPNSITALVENSTFFERPKETLWAKPFVYAGENSRFVFLAAMKSNLLRTISHLIDEYASDSGKKGMFFQEHCRDLLTEAITNGPLRDIAWVAPKSVQTNPQVGDIDICVVVGSTLIVVEVKFIVIPSDAHEYWKADQALENAVLQLRRKTKFIIEEPGRFIEMLKQTYGAPATTNITSVIPLILSSDAYHSGFPIDDIAVADLSILTSFFDNHFIEAQALSEGGLEEHATPIYSNPSEACKILSGYLLEPEVIKRLRAQIVPREMRYPTDLWSGEQEITVVLKSVEIAKPPGA